MSLTMSQGEGVTVITVTSNPNSKWPILCQILGTLCYSPVCAVSQHVKAKMMGIYTAVGIVQIIVGILNTLTGILFLRFGIHDHIMMMYDAPFWLGGVALVVGIVSIVAAQFPSYFLLLVAVVLNKVSAVLAMIGLALYSWDLMSFQSTVVQHYEYMKYDKMIREGVDVTMMIFSGLQLCVTLSFSVLTLKEMFETGQSAKSVEDLHFYKPLKEEFTVSHVC